jgi:hypothetical protein
MESTDCKEADDLIDPATEEGLSTRSPNATPMIMNVLIPMRKKMARIA